MGHTYTQVMVHGVFSTKDRRPFLKPELMSELVKIIGGILRKRDSQLVAMNGPEDHVHLLGRFHPKYSLSDMFRDIKAISSDWIHDRYPNQKSFAWQGGYSAFSVSKSNVPAVEKYIASQVEHHRQQTFEEELIALLQKHGIEFDERYLHD